MNTKVLTWGVSGLIFIALLFWVTLFVERPMANKGEYQASTTYPWMNATTTENEASALYESVSGRFSVSYSDDLTPATSSPRNDQFGDGIAFIFPESLTQGTNLSADSRISIEEKTAAECLPTSFVAQPMIGDDDAIKTETIGSNTYSTFGFSDAGAGNRYDTSIYSVAKGGQCYGIQLFLHSTNIGNYDPGTVTEFDSAKAQSYFREILEGFEIK